MYTTSENSFGHVECHRFNPAKKFCPFSVNFLLEMRKCLCIHLFFLRNLKIFSGHVRCNCKNPSQKICSRFEKKCFTNYFSKHYFDPQKLLVGHTGFGRYNPAEKILPEIQKILGSKSKNIRQNNYFFQKRNIFFLISSSGHLEGNLDTSVKKVLSELREILPQTKIFQVEFRKCFYNSLYVRKSSLLKVTLDTYNANLILLPKIFFKSPK